MCEAGCGFRCWLWGGTCELRSEEHTSELQSHSDLVCRLLLDNKQGWKTKYAWRARKAVGIVKVLNLIRPYVVIKAEKADIALQESQKVLDSRQSTRRRNEQNK